MADALHSSHRLSIRRSRSPLTWQTGALSGALLIVWLWLRRIEAGAQPRKFPDVPMAISIGENGVTVASSSFSSRDGWEVIAEIKCLPEHLAIVTVWGTYFVVPARDFPNRRQFASFVEEAQRLFQAARRSTD